MSKICGYSCEHNKSGVCQISVCDKRLIISDKTEIKHLSQSYYDLHEKYYKLQQENQKYKEIIDKVMNLIKKYGKYDGEKCTQGFQMWSADFNKILEILNEVSE